MKVLVVFGVWLLVAVCAAIDLPEGRDYCCSQGLKGVSASALKDNCVSLVEMTDILMKETKEEIAGLQGVEITLDFEIQIKINAFTKAAIRCVPNNQVYGNVHIMIDDLHNIIARYPTPRNVLKNITEAEALLENQLARLRLAVNEAGTKLDPKICTTVAEFVKTSIEKAAKIFQHNLKQAESNARIFRDINLNELVDKVVESIHKCIPIKKTDFDASLKCRQNVQSAASNLQDVVRNLRIMGQLTHVAPEKSLRSLMMGIEAEGHGLVYMIANDKLQRELSE